MQTRSVLFRPRPRLFALCALGALLLLGAGAIVSLTAAKKSSPVLARTEEWEVRRGAPDAAGKKTLLRGKSLALGEAALISPQHPLDGAFPAPSTRTVTAMVGTYLNAEETAALREEVIYALCAMEFDHPFSRDVRITEGALSAAQMEDRRRDALRRYTGILPVSEALDSAVTAAPGPAESDHRTGLSLDIRLLGPLDMSRADPLLRSETGEWLAENMWRYGFIRRYAPGRSEEGNCENIHLLYTGRIHAAAMHLLGLGLEDYLSLLHREGKITLLHGGAPWAAVYCFPADGTLTVSVPAEGSVSAGLDNTGWAVAAVSFGYIP